jgi:hypothetical protein
VVQLLGCRLKVIGGLRVDFEAVPKANHESEESEQARLPRGIIVVHNEWFDCENCLV